MAGGARVLSRGDGESVSRNALAALARDSRSRSKEGWAAK